MGAIQLEAQPSFHCEMLVADSPALGFDRFLFVIIFLFIFQEICSAQSSSRDDIHIPMEAEFYYLRVYQNVEDHKALAVGLGGNWASAKGMPSPQAAEEGALAECQKALQESSSYKGPSTQPCVLFDVDGRATGKAPPTGIPFGTVLKGPDYPLGSGLAWEATNHDARGIMILLHGCNRVKMGGWWIAWVNYYRSSGFRVILPDSFAEARDEETCGNPGEAGIDKQTRILKLRIAQTRRTLDIVRKQFPGEPIYLHGHSEGGVVAQALGEEVAGIIVTGASCGVGNSKAYWTASDVPVLVIAGTNDPYVLNGNDAEEFAAYCKNVVGPGKLTAVSVREMGHLAAIWWPQVNKAIARFLNVADIDISRRSADVIHYPIRVDQIPGYREAKANKALAADENGNLRWEDALESPFDAEESTLFGCDELSGRDPFSNPPHVHACELVDVNGKRVVK